MFHEASAFPHNACELGDIVSSCLREPAETRQVQTAPVCGQQVGSLGALSLISKVETGTRAPLNRGLRLKERQHGEAARGALEPVAWIRSHLAVYYLWKL